MPKTSKVLSQMYQIKLPVEDKLKKNKKDY